MRSEENSTPTEKWLTTSKITKQQKMQSRKPHKIANEKHEKIAEEKLINMGLKSPKSKSNKNFQRPCSTGLGAKSHLCAFVHSEHWPGVLHRLIRSSTTISPHPVLNQVIIIQELVEQETRGFYFFLLLTGKSVPEILRICQLLVWPPFLRSTYFYILIFFTILHMCALQVTTLTSYLLVSHCPLFTNLLESSCLIIWFYDLLRLTRTND